jgi:hypothetical protein
MNKLAIASFALAFVMLSASSQASNSSPAQTRCNLTEANGPGVRGVRSGMSTQQFLALFPGIAKKRETKDAIEKAKSTTGAEAVSLGADPVTDGDARQFAGIESVAATFYKGHAVDFTVQYGGATWRNVDEWIAKLAESFKLPGAQDWVVGPDESPNKVLRCNGIMIEAAIQGGSASIRVKNTGDLREIEERTRAADDKQRHDVKP